MEPVKEFSIFSTDDIITALATPAGSARLGIIRVTGAGALDAVSGFLVDFEKISTDAPFILPALFDLWGRTAAVPFRLWFWPERRGYTGQETVELHLPGSPPILNGVLSRLCESGKIRMAKPGEFTLRAFLGGRLDLTQAEAVLGVIDAEDDAGLETALAQLAGNLGTPLRGLRDRLVETLGDLEAGFDFADEDIEFISRADLLDRVNNAAQFLEERLRQMTDRTDHRRQPRVVLTGAPNAGKSSLFNRLISHSSDCVEAIVSEIAGTTRDYLEGDVQIGEHSFRLVDTAGEGAAESVSDLSNEGREAEVKARLEETIHKQTSQALDGADLVLLCRSACDPAGWNFPEPDSRQLILLTKSDQLRADDRTALPRRADLLVTSAQSLEGLDELRERIASLLFTEGGCGEVVPATAVRCRHSFDGALKSLSRADELIRQNADEVLIAYEIRDALNQIGLVLGEVQTDDILDSVFSRFCVGK